MTYIAPASKVLGHVDRLVDWRRGLKPAPVTVEWDLSNRCVLGCQDCHFAHTHVRGPWVSKSRVLPMAFDSCGDLADIGIVERAIGEMSRAGVQAVVWSGGGEPLTHPKWIDAIELAAERGLQQGMYTLGGLIDEWSGAYLAERLQWVVVSLDCADAETYAAEKGVPKDRFDAACAGIRFMAGHKCGNKAAVGVSFLLHQGNYRRAGEMLALARTLGATYTTFRPAIRTSPDQPSICSDDRTWITEALPQLWDLAQSSDVEISVERFKQYRDWSGHGYGSCRGVQLNATITPDGRVWVCPQRRGNPAGLLGDLRDESFARIWSKHPGQFTVDAGCRVMCRLHPVNQTIADLERPRVHGVFV